MKAFSIDHYKQRMERAIKAVKWFNERGLRWIVLYSLRWLMEKYTGMLDTVVRQLEKHLIQIEKQRFLAGEGTICSLYHTIEENKMEWI